MKYYFAPMEGITGYIYRNAHHEFYDHIDKYFTPFIAVNQTDHYKTRGWTDILPENNPGLILIPQILSNHAEGFIRASEKIRDMGYHEINLNLGCPSETVVAKNKGSGFLALQERLDRFLDEIFSASITRISVKTRIGKNSPEEFRELIKIFNKYPMSELIIHPRIQKDFYKNKPNWEVFREALQQSRNPVCYNGDLFTADDYYRFTTEFPEVDMVMLGRGLIANPGLVASIKEHTGLEKRRLKAFHDKIYKDYQEVLSGDRNVLFKMKELWHYMLPMFEEHEKCAKKIKKAERLYDYEAVVSRIFAEQ